MQTPSLALDHNQACSVVIHGSITRYIEHTFRTARDREFLDMPPQHQRSKLLNETNYSMSNMHDLLLWGH